MNASLLSCTCSNVFQDDAYGQGQRVHVLGRLGWSCTTCGTVRATREAPRSRSVQFDADRAIAIANPLAAEGRVRTRRSGGSTWRAG